MDLSECIEKGLLKRARVEEGRIERELKESRKDFIDAKTSYKMRKFKWAIIQCYYSIFHSTRAVLFFHGLKERSHSALIPFLEDLIKKQKLEQKFVNDFKAAMFTREEADYRAEYSQERAKKLIDIADEFNKRMRKLLGDLRKGIL